MIRIVFINKFACKHIYIYSPTYKRIMRLIISGGGIAGLTTGILAKQLGYNPIIIEKRSHISSASFGGGIGLWPNSQMVM